MAKKLRWDKLGKKPRDPGWADERPEPSGSAVPPRSPFLRRKGGQGLFERLRFQAEAPTQTRRSNKKKPKQKKAQAASKSAATTPFDRYSLDTPSPAALRAAERKKPPAQQTSRRKRKTPQQTAARKKKAADPISQPHPRATARPPKSGFVIGKLHATVESITDRAIVLSWPEYAGVSGWRVSCADRDDCLVRKAQVSREVLKLTISELEQVRQPMTIRVTGSDDNGRLICKGVVKATLR